MTLKDWNLKMQRDEVLRRVLPLEMRKSFPFFTIENGVLCLSFVCFRTCINKKQVYVYNPSLFLKVSYPDGKLLSYDIINHGDSREGHIMAPKKKEQIEKLALFCDAVFTTYETSSDEFERIINNYHSLLFSVMEKEQIDELIRYVKCGE